MVKLGDQLRKEAQSRQEKAKAAAIKREMEENERARIEAEPIAREIIKGLPDALKKAAKRGDRSIKVLEAKYEGGRRFRFNKVDSHVAYLIGEWASSELLECHHSKYEFYEGGESPESLWISW